MEAENEQSSIENSLETATKLEKFAGDLNTAGDCVREFGARIPLQDLPSFDKLAGHEQEMMTHLNRHFGLDATELKIAKEYSISGTPDTSGAGVIHVQVIATNDPQVFLGKYTYADGEIVWAIRPLEVEE